MRTRTLLRIFAVALLPSSTGVALVACNASSSDASGIDAGSDASLDGPSFYYDAVDVEAQPFNTSDSGCSSYVIPFPDGGDAAAVPDATDDAGFYPQAYCSATCLTPAFVCEPTGDGGLRCVNCTGRRPQGLVEERVALREPGLFFAEMARLESASVLAFRVLARELTMLRAPRSLVRAAERAARDEIRHARAAGALARRYGHEPLVPRIEPHAPRALEAIALENAVEGCVHETWGALAAHHQAIASRDVVVRRIMRRIAKDETDHAALAWRVARWIDERLDPAARARVNAARNEAARALAQSIGEPPAALCNVVGLAHAHEARQQMATLNRLLWKRAA